MKLALKFDWSEPFTFIISDTLPLELDASRPVIIDGYKMTIRTIHYNPGTPYETTVHYNENYFIQCNWGWNGFGNSTWYSPTGFNPPNGQTYNSNNKMMVYIYPST